MPDLFDKLRAVEEALARYRPTGPVPFDTVFEALSGPCEGTVAGRHTLILGSNNYLGLSFHPEVVAAGQAALARLGSGTTGSRVANGTLAEHRALERELAAHLDLAEALVFTTGHQANLSLLQGLLGPDDTVLLDSDCHASLWDGARLSGAQLLAFRHNSPEDLGRKLARLPRGATNRLVCIEGIYSLRGDASPLGAIAALCRQHGAYLLVDEAHSYGLYGAAGRGLAAGRADFVVGTFSKALGGVGGFAASRHLPLRLLHFSARAYTYTASGSPASIASVRAALHLLAAGDDLRTRLWRNVARLRAGFAALGIPLGEVPAPILAIPTGTAARTVAIWRALLDAGLYVNVVLPPGCPEQRCLLRTSVSAAHTDAQLDQALAILRKVLA